MEREPTLKKALEPYLEGLDKDINYDPTGSKISALFLAVLYSTKQGSFSPTEGDRQYAKKVVELLLEYGADPTRHEGGNPQYATPLSAAKVLADSGRDPEGMYELLLKHSINSATEGAAFENKFTEGLGKAIKGLAKLGKKGLEKAITSKGGVAERIANKFYQSEIDKRKQGARDYIKNNPDEFKGDIDSLPDGQAKEATLINILESDKFPVLVSNEEADKALKKKIAEKLVGVSNPMSSDLISTIKNISSHLVSTPDDTRLWSILLNNKYSKVIKDLKSLDGLSVDPGEFVDQLSFIAYYSANNKDLGLLKLKDGKTWKGLKAMKSLHKPKKEYISKMTGREIVLKDLRKKGPGLAKNDGIKFLTKTLFKGDQDAAIDFIENNGEKVGNLLNKKYEKTFDGDNLTDKLIKDFSDLLESTKEPEESVESEVLTGREIILTSLGKKGPNLSKDDGMEYISKFIFNGNMEKANQFFEKNRKAVTSALNKKYEKTFEEDNLSELFNSELKSISDSEKKSSKASKSPLNDEQKQAALALQSLGYSKTASTAMVKGREGDSSQIVYEALKAAGSKGGK